MDELARLQGVEPVASVDDIVRDVFESGEERDEFLAHVAAWRRTDLA